MKICDYCGSANKEHKLTCKHCGASLPSKITGVVLSRPESLQGDLIYSNTTTSMWDILAWSFLLL